jgi:hypothetical protein
VQVYDVLVRICTGFGLAREMMGLSEGAYPGGSPVAVLGGEDEAAVLRRQFDNLLAMAGATVLGSMVPGLGTVSPGSPPGPPVGVPERIGRVDVEGIRELTRAVAVEARTVGGQAGPACSLAGWADGYLAAQASEAAREALLAALADLHVIAAWCCHDSYAPVPAHQHFARAVELALAAGDHYQVSYTLHYAAWMLIHRDQPDKALKLTQLGEVHLLAVPGGDPRVAPLCSQLLVLSALAQAQLAVPGYEVTARRVRSELARSQDGWEPPSLHSRADLDFVISKVHLELGALDTAEPLAAAAVETFTQGNYGRGGVLAGITLARVHLLAGEPDAGRLAAQAVGAVLPLRSGAARTALLPLARDLETRPGPDFTELARQAHQAAATRM